MPLIQLPPEVLLRVMEEIDDVFTLRALALSCHSVRNIIFKHERTLCRRVLKNLVAGLGAKDVAVAWEARQQLSAMPARTGWSAPAQEQFLERHHAITDEQSVADMTMCKALSIARLYDAMRYFACDCAEGGLRNWYERHPSHLSQEPGASELEIIRIQRALCRFELYSCLFTGLDSQSSDYGEQYDERERSVFWDRFAPWENEQVTCVYDYFYRRLTDMLEELATLDADWAVHLSILGGVNDNVVQLWLARGLSGLHSFFTATIDSRRIYLTNSPPKSNFKPTFLSDGLRIATNPSIDTPLSDMTPDEQGKVIKPASKDDGDSGPERILRWAHQTESPADAPDQGFVLSERQMGLRECGYVFWDCARIDRWGLLQRPSQGDFSTADKRTEREYESRDGLRELAETLAEQGKTKSQWVV
ncbi:hypothetical protein LTR37_011330 [Vermiconidia calcicola]|uniref:Uncharacterized protein n=1 Tax=Vermiconidia calcicola TaxID=1690605 RepID=A0ACC3N3R3_9PEZI|nr:hypothetical protein LTR37_011330 [Vermiconidia calcicola]